MTSPHEQKKRKLNGTVVVTANRLDDGSVVYRTVNDDWTTDIASAAVVAAAAAAVLLQRAEADALRAVGAYIAPVELAAGKRVVPGNLRERIRVGGPTFALPGAGMSVRPRESGDPGTHGRAIPLRRWVPAFAGTNGAQASARQEI
jgi:hypothetical protein